MVSEARYNKKPLVVGIAGGTGSGKSTVARAILESIPERNVAIIEQDCYYKDQSHLPREERVNVNYDHPLAFDTGLLIEHVKRLIS
jgi:uridine kinase